jgi:Protein of unknown function (DUF3631)
VNAPASRGTAGRSVPRPRIRLSGTTAGCTNEVWRPLLAIAELAGGDWPARARAAALALNSSSAGDDPSLGLQLLADVHAIFKERDAEKITTAELIGALAKFEEQPWGEWWFDASADEPRKGGPRRLANLLHPYGIRSTKLRIGDTTVRGYWRGDFLDAWERFAIPSQDGTSVTSGTPEPHTQAVVPQVPDAPDVSYSERPPTA